MIKSLKNLKKTNMLIYPSRQVPDSFHYVPQGEGARGSKLAKVTTKISGYFFSLRSLIDTGTRQKKTFFRRRLGAEGAKLESYN